MTLGERIALARKKAGLSQEQLGERLGVSRQAVSKWESSQANPDVAYVAELCRICGVSCDWLLLGEEGAREAPPARCGSCGAIVTGLDRYCPQCGHPLQKEEADTYSLVLVDPRKNLTAAFDALAWLSRRPWCAPESPLPGGAGGAAVPRSRLPHVGAFRPAGLGGPGCLPRAGDGGGLPGQRRQLGGGAGAEAPGAAPVPPQPAAQPDSHVLRGHGGGGVSGGAGRCAGALPVLRRAGENHEISCQRGRSTVYCS